MCCLLSVIVRLPSLSYTSITTTASSQGFLWPPIESGTCAVRYLLVRASHTTCSTAQRCRMMGFLHVWTLPRPNRMATMSSPAMLTVRFVSQNAHLAMHSTATLHPERARAVPACGISGRPNSRVPWLANAPAVCACSPVHCSVRSAPCSRRAARTSRHAVPAGTQRQRTTVSRQLRSLYRSTERTHVW